MPGVLELLKTMRVVGLPQMLRLRRAQRLAWPQILNGFYTTRTVQALFNVGFLDELRLRGSVDPEAFAERHGLDAAILKSLCESLFSHSILQKNGSGFRLDSRGELLVDVARGWFDGVYGYEGVFHDLEALLRREKEYGKDVRRRSDFVARGSGEIENKIYFPLAIDIIRRNGFKRVLDLGCGEGTFLRSLCLKAPDVTGYGIDIAPQAIAEGDSQLEALGLEGRIHLSVLDISKIDAAPETLRGVEVATTFFVLHELLFWGRDRVIEFLRSFRTIFPGVPLLVFETIRPSPEEMRRKPGMAIPYFLQHDLTHQRPVGRPQWQELFADAGFTAVDERYLAFARTSIFTLR